MKKINLLLISMIISFIACDNSNNNNNLPPRTDITSPKILKYEKHKTYVKIQFDEELLTGSVNNNSVFVKDADLNVITGTLSFDKTTNIVTFTPANGFELNINYRLTVTQAIEDLSENSLENIYMQDFSFEQAIITYRYTPRQLDLSFIISKKLDKSTLESNIKVRVQGEIDYVPGTIVFDDYDNMLSFKYDNFLIKGEAYAYWIFSNIKCIDGFSLEVTEADENVGNPFIIPL